MAKLNTKTSVVDYLKSQGKDSSYSARKELATSMGISNYSGTASQNTQLLKKLQSGTSTTKNTTNQNKNTKTTQTNTSTSNKNKTTTTKNLNGVDDATTKKATSSFTQSSAVTKADTTSQKALSNLESLTSQKNIVSDGVWETINSQFVVPSAVTEADAYLKNQLAVIQSGKTSYTDQIKDMMSQIQNREKFSYDVDTDPLFQQALASAMGSGKQAMQDTIGQASALTGGYGSTYATSAGNQAYNSFIEDAYNNLPQYYQMAREAYQMEGDEMYRQLGMLNEADATEYGRNVTAYDATYQHRNQIYNEAYTQYRDNKSDAFAMANLQLSEHGQQVSDAYNFYNASSNYADTLYSREFDEWNAEVNQAMQYAGMLNNDWWNQTNFDEGVRQYEKSFAEDVRQFDTSFAENQRQFNENLAENKRQHNAEMSYKYSALKQDNDQFYANLNYQKTKSGTVTRNGVEYKEATETQNKKALDAYNSGGYAALEQYVASLPDDVDVTGITEYVKTYNQWDNWTIKDDTTNWNNWLIPGNDDNNDTYTFGNETKTFKELKKEINKSGLPQDEKDKLLESLRKQSKK
jgi:hypothetical protein